MTSDQQNHLLELFAACSQPTATEAEVRELQAVLRTDTDARKLWFLYQDMELGLERLSQSFQQPAEFPDARLSVSKSHASEIVSPAVQASKIQEGSSSASWFARKKQAAAVVALVCLSLMIVFGVQTWSPTAGNFTVESPTHGTTFALSDHTGKMIALHFLLKSECPFCLKLTNDYARLGASEPDVLHVFLKPDSADEIRVWAGKIKQEGLEKPPVIYRDSGARLARRFGIPDGYEFHGQSMHYPALVLLDGTGKELFRYVGKDNTDRMKPDDFVTMLAMVANHK